MSAIKLQVGMGGLVAKVTLNRPDKARTMGEGWETRRRRDDGNDHAIIRLALPGCVQLVEIDTTNREVQPLMQDMVDTLARFVELDVPFLLEERAAVVQNLKEVMGRADVSTSEKYRLILEAYQAELEYGQTIQAYEGRLGTGADARTVEFARIGRVSLMYRTLDGVETGYWDANQKMWVVDARYHDYVEEAIRVANEDGPKELLIVPVPAPQEVRS